MSWLKWGTVALGVGLCLMPLVFGYSGNPAELAISLATGGVIALFGAYEKYKTAPLQECSRLCRPCYWAAGWWALPLRGAWCSWAPPPPSWPAIRAS
jgi:hypothetical protein